MFQIIPRSRAGLAAGSSGLLCPAPSPAPPPQVERRRDLPSGLSDTLVFRNKIFFNGNTHSFTSASALPSASLFSQWALQACPHREKLPGACRGAVPGKASGDTGQGAHDGPMRSAPAAPGQTPEGKAHEGRPLRSLAGVKNVMGVPPPTHTHTYALLGTTGLEVPLALLGDNSMRRALPPPRLLLWKNWVREDASRASLGPRAVSTCAWFTPGAVASKTPGGWALNQVLGLDLVPVLCPRLGNSAGASDVRGGGRPPGRWWAEHTPHQQQDLCLFAERTAPGPVGILGP